MNEFRNTKIESEEEIQPEETVAAPTKKPGAGIGFLQSLLGGSFLSRDKVVKLFPYLVFLTVIAIAYIFNSNYAVRKVLQISKTKKQNEEYRYEYLTTKSKLMMMTRQSELVKKLEARGIVESKVPPRKISSDANQ